MHVPQIYVTKNLFLRSAKIESLGGTKQGLPLLSLNSFPTFAARRSWRSSGVRLSVPPPSKAHLTRQPAPALRSSPAPLSHLPPSHAVEHTAQVSSSWSGRLAWIMPTRCLAKCLQGKLAVVPVIMCIAGSQDEPTSTMCG